MERTYINEAQKAIGGTVKVQGFIENLRILIPLANARLILEESYANVCVILIFFPKKESDNEE